MRTVKTHYCNSTCEQDFSPDSEDSLAQLAIRTLSGQYTCEQVSYPGNTHVNRSLIRAILMRTGLLSGQYTCEQVSYLGNTHANRSLIRAIHMQKVLLSGQYTCEQVSYPGSAYSQDKMVFFAYFVVVEI